MAATRDRPHMPRGRFQPLRVKGGPYGSWR